MSTEPSPPVAAGPASTIPGRFPEASAQPQSTCIAQPTPKPRVESEPCTTEDTMASVPTAPKEAPAFSWLKPHAQFVVILVGPNERPFALQKDFLCAKSSHYRKYFASQGDETVEALVKLPEFSEEVFGYAQHYMYTGLVFPSDINVPSPAFPILLAVWKLGSELGIEDLCERCLKDMCALRVTTAEMPDAELMTHVCSDTPEGSPIRELLIEWAAEFMRSTNPKTADFAKSLPQHVLSELVLAMSKQDTTPLVQLGADESIVSFHSAPTKGQSRRKMVHYLDEGDEVGDESVYMPQNKKQHRRSDHFATDPTSKAIARKLKAAAARKVVKRRPPPPTPTGEPLVFSDEQKLGFCQDLLVRMLSGPGFWTRLVGPFREPVDPVKDNVPDYHEKIKKPMDLLTIRSKMDHGQYASAEEFYEDMNLIFSNCKAYHQPGSSVLAACEKLERTFSDKYAGMNKWLAKLGGDEEH